MTGITRDRTTRYSPPLPRTALPAHPATELSRRERVVVDGMHLACGGIPFRVRGVTYGSFLPRPDGVPFPPAEVCRKDLAAMAEHGLNLVRIYEPPPPELLDLAGEFGLRLLVGLQYDDWRMLPPNGRRGRRRVLDAGQRAVDAAMLRFAGRPEVLAVVVGNEVPADLVRWYGIRQVEEVLAELIEQVHAADPGMLATYVNYPTTEFLDVSGQDLACFNVFLEKSAEWRSYLRHLQIVAGERPLLVTECGLAAALHGEARQAEALVWQLRAADETGVGATVFSWTDEWGVGAKPVTGWGFGITREDRTPKPAAAVVKNWAHRSLEDQRPIWPAISVVVCAYNEEGRIAACLDSLARCDYPGLEVIVCDDGSTDGTLEIARGYPYRVLALAHGGLSRARNAGLAATGGAIVAYLDGDAQCHPDWPYHMALGFEEQGVVAVGGPNLPVADAEFAERVVAACPGGPMHVLLSDDRAEHIPGCNMAMRRDALSAVGGFDEAFVSAGDDVDVCWKLLDRGGQIAFASAAQVRHHRRGCFSEYLKQQYGYGRSERMVAGRHPHRYNQLGQARWRGFIYGGQRVLPSLLRSVIYHGIAGGAPFQPTRRRTAEVALFWASALLPLLVLPALAGLVLAIWSLWWLALPVAVLLLFGGHAVLVATATQAPRGETRPKAFRLMVGLLHVAQPLVRAWGRVRGSPLEPNESEHEPVWHGNRETWLHDLRRALAHSGYRVAFGDAGVDWDLRLSRHGLIAASLTVAVAWKWIPAYRLRVRPRPLAVFLFASGLALMSVALAWGIALAAGSLVGSALEALTTRRDVRRVVAETTAGVSSG